MNSGYTGCACGTCFNETVSNDVHDPDICSECEEAGCEKDGECCCEELLEE